MSEKISQGLILLIKELELDPKEQRELNLFLSGDGNLEGSLNSKLYEYFVDEMPYGTAKGRTGDPDQFIFQKLYDLSPF